MPALEQYRPRNSARAAGLTRRAFGRGLLAAFALPFAPEPLRAETDVDITFVFTSDTHACLMRGGLAPKCQAEGKTDENLRRHIRAINSLPGYAWPSEINGLATGLVSAGMPISVPRGVVIGGDLTDDGGGQVAIPGEGTQIQQFSRRYQQGVGEDQIHFPVYVGLGNHDLDQDGPPSNPEWYRRELRDYVELNHRPSVFYKPPLPATDYDIYSDDYSWDWGNVHLIQGERFLGDTLKDAIDGLPWLRADLAAHAAGRRPVIVFQHYGWDPFSVQRWDPGRRRFDAAGLGPSRWWSEQQRNVLLETIAGYNIIGIFHGHQHATPMIYRVGSYDVFKPKAAFLGGFAVVRVGGNFMDVVLAEADADGKLIFTNAFSKRIAATAAVPANARP